MGALLSYQARWSGYRNKGRGVYTWIVFEARICDYVQGLSEQVLVL